jgi:signal transduction histidine kinase
MPSRHHPPSQDRRGRRTGAATLRRDARELREREATDWEKLPRRSREELEELGDLLLAVKGGDFTLRLSPRRGGLLSRTGALLNDVLALAEQLQLVSRYKSEFLANTSHELRTPLNSLLILSRMLAENREGNLTPEQVRFASTVHASGNELLSLIDDILDLSRVEAGKMRIEPVEVRLDAVRAHLEESFRHVAEQKGLRFEVTTAPDLPPVLYTDAGRLQQILKNLLSNAFKFTSQGGVSVTVTRAPRATALDDGPLAFAVRDTGIGIARDEQKLIFDAFQQARDARSGKYGGTGLGLTISREISRLLGGTIHVDSAPGRGSTFTLLLPEHHARPEMCRAAASTPAPVVEPAPLPPDPSFAGRTVLLADDDVRSAFVIDSVLESHRMKVLHAENGDEAIQLLEENPEVDLVLMDAVMPGMNGLTAIQHIRQRPEFGRLPIISLTARAMTVDRDRAIEAGASDHVSKPVDPELLLAVMQRCLG